MLRIGCCGFPVGMARYAQELQVAEVQQTFYRLPKEATVRRWRAAVPGKFMFTVKAWQGITHPGTSPTYRRAGNIPDEVKARLGHFQPTEPVFEAWKRTREVAKILSASMILLQAPPSFVQSEEHEGNLAAFFPGIDREKKRIVLELRSPWDRDTLLNVCRRFDLIHCVDPFRESPVTGAPFYLRLHGSPPGSWPGASPSGYRLPGQPPKNRMYSYHYTEKDLRWLRDRIAGWEAGGEVYCLFNNISMWEDARAFRDLMEARR